MSTQTVQNFFSSHQFMVPAFQRDYAWKQRNIDDLFSDVEEALLLSSLGDQNANHYLGTFILAQPVSHEPAHVVDGQQRLTTLTMFLDVLIDAVDDPVKQQYYRHIYIENPISGRKFEVYGANREFFNALLNGIECVPLSDGQERLKLAYDRIENRVSVLKAQGGEVEVLRWLQCISRMEVLEFLVQDEGRAIRMFQSVNDRGVPLSRMDIVKSLLVYYSNRYLGGELDAQISEWFGEAFRCFSKTKRLAKEDGYAIRTIASDKFTEDDVLRYHYLSFDRSPYQLTVELDYWVTARTILETFLKPALQELRSSPEKLRAFIVDYTQDLCGGFKSLLALIEGARTDRQLYTLWVVQDLSATLYPLTIRLHQMGWLHREVPEQDSRNMLALLECVDMRVFKLRGTNPQADMYKLAANLPYRLAASPQMTDTTTVRMRGVVQELQSFIAWGMSDAAMLAALSEMALYRHPAQGRMLLALEDSVRQSMQREALSVSELASFIRAGVTAEHILSQDPLNAFDPLALGFDDADDYLRHRHLLGNLVWLEGDINSACNNRPVYTKATDPNLYARSAFASVRHLSAQLSPSGVAFNKARLIQRARQLAELMVQTWPVSA